MQNIHDLWCHVTCVDWTIRSSRPHSQVAAILDLEAKEQMSSKQVLKLKDKSFPLVARFLFLNLVMYPHWQSSTREISQIWLHGDFYPFFFPLLLATENLQNHFFFSKSLICFNFSFWWNFASEITLSLASRELQVKGTDHLSTEATWLP
jgi:hypothetical protein